MERRASEMQVQAVRVRSNIRLVLVIFRGRIQRGGRDKSPVPLSGMSSTSLCCLLLLGLCLSATEAQRNTRSSNIMGTGSARGILLASIE